MKVKGLSKEEAIQKLELIKKQVDFNNKLNKFVRKFRKEHNISRENFNGCWDTPTPEMQEAMKDILIKDSLGDLSWMPTIMKREYAKDTASIFGNVYSIAVNTYLLKDIKDLESYIETLETIDTEENINDSIEDLDFKVERDIPNTRINLYFDYIPSDEERKILKHNGFKWSRFLGAWTRQLTTAAEKSLSTVISQFKELNKENE